MNQDVWYIITCIPTIFLDRPFKPLLDKVLIRNLSVLFITWKTENKTPNHITNYTAYWIDR